ncbi:MAG: Type 1 glutamine amidotransferase-like domain-containing protein [Christensenellaceae bacterium]|nr:Type 1 glutamine amidotransferase-like domain-containing protein [Christensenellaceae bacterium]
MDTDRIIVAIGGGEIKLKSTALIDRYIADLTKARAGDNKPKALFFPTASHDSFRYFNAFRKTYSSDMQFKLDIALLAKCDITIEHIQEKIEVADLIYIGSGDTPYMVDLWHERGIDKLILEAYNRGTIIAGISAGANVWFDKYHSDIDVRASGLSNYSIHPGLGIIKGIVCPHFNIHRDSFLNVVSDTNCSPAYGISNNSALVFRNEMLVGSIGYPSYVYFQDDYDNKLYRVNPITY